MKTTLEDRLRSALMAEAARLPVSTTTADDIRRDAADPAVPASVVALPSRRFRRVIAVGAAAAAVVAVATVGAVTAHNASGPVTAGGPVSTANSSTTAPRIPRGPMRSVESTDVGAGIGPQIWPACRNPRDPNFRLSTGDAFSSVPFGDFKVLERKTTSDGRPFVITYQTAKSYVHFTSCRGDARRPDGPSHESFSETDEYVATASPTQQNPYLIIKGSNPLASDYLAVVAPIDAVAVRVLDKQGGTICTLPRVDEAATADTQVAAGEVGVSDTYFAENVGAIVAYAADGSELMRIFYELAPQAHK